MQAVLPISCPLPPRETGLRRVTPAEAIAAAAAVGLTLRLVDAYSAWLVDAEGRYVFWWAADDVLYLRPFNAERSGR